MRRFAFSSQFVVFSTKSRTLSLIRLGQQAESDFNTMPIFSIYRVGPRILSNILLFSELLLLKASLIMAPGTIKRFLQRAGDDGGNNASIVNFQNVVPSFRISLYSNGSSKPINPLPLSTIRSLGLCYVPATVTKRFHLLPQYTINWKLVYIRLKRIL